MLSNGLRRSPSGALRWGGVLGVAAILLAVLVPQSLARSNDEWQFSGLSVVGDEMMYGFSSPNPPFSRAMLRRSMDRLGMDEAQREVAQSLYSAFEQEYLSIWLENTERNADRRTQQMHSQDWATFEREMHDASESYRTRMKQLADAFVLDFELMLSAEQSEIWEAMERDKKRGERLALATDGRYVAVDLGVVIEGLELDASTRDRLGPVISAYHNDVDSALVPALRHADRVLSLAREARDARAAYNALFAGGDARPDQGALLGMQEEMNAKGNAARDAALDLRRMYGNVLGVQRRTIEEIKRELPAEHHEAFERATVQRASAEGMFAWDNYSRFTIAAQILENLEQTRTMMEMQLTMMQDSLSEEQVGQLREMAIMMRRAKPLTREQRRELDRIKARHKQRTDALESRARSQAREARQSEESNHISVRVPGGSVSLYRVDESGGRTGWRGSTEIEAEIQRERARIDQDSVNELRAILDFYQRALIANY